MAGPSNGERVEVSHHADTGGRSKTATDLRDHLSEKRRRAEADRREREESRGSSDGRSEVKLTLEEELVLLRKRLDEQDKLLTDLKKSSSAGNDPQTDERVAGGGKEGEDSGHPFTEAIMAFPMPENLKSPTNVDFYFGNTDPQEHLDTFLVAMTCQGAKDAYKCRTFPLTLKKAALRWYSKLEPNSVGCWKDLSAKFLGHFTTSKIQPRSEHHLSLIKQEKGEPLRDFLTRFNDEYLSITDIEPSVGLHLLMRALRPGESPPPPGSGGGGFRREGRREGSKKPEARYLNYTPLNASKSQIAREIMNAKLAEVERPRPLRRPPTRENRNKRCSWHGSYGHTDEECIQLRDALETLVRRGKLGRYLLYPKGGREDVKRSNRPLRRRS